MLPWKEKGEMRKTKDNIKYKDAKNNIKYKDTKDNINYKDTKDNIKLSQFTLLSKTLTKEAAFIKGLEIALRVTVPSLIHWQYSQKKEIRK
jgi:predicted lipoprotein